MKGPHVKVTGEVEDGDGKVKGGGGEGGERRKTMGYFLKVWKDPFKPE